MKKEEKMIYRIIAQKNGITVTAELKEDATFEEAKRIATEEVLMPQPKAYQPFVVLPIATKERWDSKCINFCPRCGASLKDYEMEQSERFDCYECDTSMEVHIHAFYDED